MENLNIIWEHDIHTTREIPLAIVCPGSIKLSSSFEKTYYRKTNCELSIVMLGYDKSNKVLIIAPHEGQPKKTQIFHKVYRTKHGLTIRCRKFIPFVLREMNIVFDEKDYLSCSVEFLGNSIYLFLSPSTKSNTRK